MVDFCIFAYFFGAVIHFSIVRLAAYSGLRSVYEEKLERLSYWVLAFAYIISVACYLNLLGSFAVSLSPLNNAFHALQVTSGAFTLVLLVGWTKGLLSLRACFDSTGI
jgi:hypothetical protein